MFHDLCLTCDLYSSFSSNNFHLLAFPICSCIFFISLLILYLSLLPLLFMLRFRLDSNCNFSHKIGYRLLPSKKLLPSYLFSISINFSCLTLLKAHLSSVHMNRFYIIIFKKATSSRISFESSKSIFRII